MYLNIFLVQFFFLSSSSFFKKFFNGDGLDDMTGEYWEMQS